MNQGVPPAPPAGPGSSGSQQAAGAPAPDEAKNAVGSLFGPPASGQDNRVPFARFKEINDRLKGAEAELAQYKAQSVPSVPQQKSPDQLLAEIRAMAKKGVDDPDVLFGALEQMVNVRTSSVVNDALKSVFEQQEQQFEMNQFAAIENEARSKVLHEFPEIQDQNSDLFKAADAIYRADKFLRRLPDGEYRAVREADYQRTKKTSRPAHLSTPGIQGNAFATMDGGDDGYADDRKSVLQAMREGKLADVDKFFTKHADKFLTKPGY